ncbi:unnamed protein product [Didymodactylos carnosus]|uniref:Secernin-2 n=1 Tax=Didymodactylos carnosus TaxID=1234261 RepID=A0A814R9Z8_9BILA|nr:unnamed protein product [Didymodactylos carnosus]CAF3893350.1 unnamed protein product [Didymodactylos carnosus]
MSFVARSCDTFVVFPPCTDSHFIIFGKNSDRPSNEIQEVILVSPNQRSEDTVECTHIKIPTAKTYHCILSKPAWCWGAEMGSNEYGVCVGNDAVHTKIPYDGREPALTGLDIVRLAIERSKTADDAMKTICDLIETYGQGGSCFDVATNLPSGYDNSFIVVDQTGGWIIETADRVWVAKKLTEGYHSISNVLTIGTDYDLTSKNLEKFAQEIHLWNGSGKLDFAKTFKDPSSCSDLRLKNGRKLLEKLTANNTFSALDMMAVLRDEQSGICMSDKTDSFLTTGSQVSVLKTGDDKKKFSHCHFFTATPNPKTSLFKPFIFSKKAEIGILTISPPSQVESTRAHPLYVAHRDLTKTQLKEKRLEDFERDGVKELLAKLKSDDEENIEDILSLFHDAVSAEMELLDSP